MKKFLIYFLCILILFSVVGFETSAVTNYSTSVSYDSYIYNSSMEPVKIPSPFSVQKVYTGNDITSVEFNNITDVAFDGNNLVYLCDTGNNRVITVDKGFTFIFEMSSFFFNGQEEHFSEPQGLYATKNRLYVSDTGNQRIVIFEIKDNNYSAISVLGKPVISALGDNYEYKPTRLTVDSTGKIYLVGAGINQGLICLDENGVFLSFLGAPKVEINVLESLWRKIATKEQLSKMQSYVPTEYNSVTIDNNGFLYTTSQTSDKVPVAKINNSGDNVLKEPKLGEYADLGYLKKTDAAYKPYFTDLALYNSNAIGEDIFYILDSKQGKIYGYNESGYLLYTFGANGNQKGTFYSASAIEYIPFGDNGGELIVTDGFKNTVTVLKETDFSASIKKALKLYNGGYYKDSEKVWNDIIGQASGYTLAIAGLSRIDIENGNYEAAMKKAKQIREYELYAEAFGEWRDSFLREHFGGLLFSFILIAVAIIVAVILLKRCNLTEKLSKNKIYSGYRYGTYLMFHPFDGFWDLKHEKRGNMASAVIIAALFFLFYALRLQFGGYVVTGVVSEETNVLYNIMLLLLPLCFWIISNWCFTTLMNGKGNMKDIIIATCYSLKPYVILGIPMLVLSNVLSADEVGFYTFFNLVILVWVLFLLFISLISTHDYTFGKAVLTFILILIGICLIIFIILLVISIIQNIYQFSYNIIQELSFRSF